MPRRLALVLSILALALPATALAQDQSPFTPLPPAQTAAPEQDTSADDSGGNATTGDNGGLKSWQEILIFAGGGILLLGIAWAIVSDARQAAPDTRRETVAESKALREAEHKRRKQQARAANKRARAARRRNR